MTPSIDRAIVSRGIEIIFGRTLKTSIDSLGHIDRLDCTSDMY